jgi:NTP pyrophosphatase (non-canonical NTP hydrolase)
MDGPLDSIHYLKDVIRALNTEKGWRENFSGDILPPRSGPWFAAYVALAQSEMSEALDAYRDKVWSGTREDGKPIGVGPELGDALIRILDMVDIWDIDIVYELERVIAYGHTRPYQHGGRIL